MLICTTTAALSVADPPENTLFSSAAGYPKKNVTKELQQTKGLAEPTPPVGCGPNAPGIKAKPQPLLPPLLQKIRSNRILIQRIIPRHHRQTARRHKVVLSVVVRIVPNNRSFRQMHIAVDDRFLNPAMPPNIHVREDNARIHL